MATDEQDIRRGGCLCGAVTFSASVPSPDVTLCHCLQCQRWTGSGPLATVRVQDVALQGEEHIEAYHASAHGERAFCPTCGTTLYWKMQGKPVAFMPVGLFEDQSGWHVSEEIFVDHRPGWLPAHPGAAQQTEAQMQAQLKAYLASEEGAAS